MSKHEPFARTPRPKHSPWGQVDNAAEIAPGIWHVDTPSHGGFLLSPERRAAMPAHLRDIKQWTNGNAYEEDCDVAIVVCAFPEYFSGSHVAMAREVILSFDREPKGYEVGKAYYETMRAAALVMKQGEPQAVRQTELAL